MSTPPTSGTLSKVILVTIIVLLGGASWFYGRAAFDKLEFFPPRIIGPKSSFGIGTSPETLDLTLTDVGSGLSSLRASFAQGGVQGTFFEAQFAGEKERTLSIPLMFEPYRLAEGPLLLTIEAADSSMWKRTRTIQYTIDVDLTPPTVAYLESPSPQVEGVSQLIFYRAGDSNLIRSGVVVDGKTYNGHPAWTVDKSFANVPLYAALVALSSSGKATLFAEDGAKNRTEQNLIFTPPVTISPAPHSVVLDEGFMVGTVKPLADSSLALLQAEGSISREEYVKAFLSQNQSEELPAKFRLLDRDLRKLNEKLINSVVSEIRYGTAFNDFFISPPGEAIYDVGTPLTYHFEGNEILSTTSSGALIIPPTEAEPIKALNTGSVLFAGDLGIYGTVVIMDHGLGVTTVIGGLRSATVSVGAKVERGTPVGFSGESGLIAGSHIYTEMLLQGTPVSLSEWNTISLFYKRFTRKVEEAQRAMNISVRPELSGRGS